VKHLSGVPLYDRLIASPTNIKLGGREKVVKKYPVIKGRYDIQQNDIQHNDMGLFCDNQHK
jgi:hypothetical protein